MKRVLFFLALPCLTVSSAGVAQLPTFIPGALVRVETGEMRIQGTVASQTTESIEVGIGNVGIRSTVLVESIRRIQVREARSRSQGAIRWMKTGAMLGPVMGLAAGLVSGFELFFPVAATYSAIGAALGAAYGGAIGSERWHTVYSVPRVVVRRP